MSLVIRNRYRVIERLGQGGGGSVYAVADLGREGGAERRLALKALFFSGGDDATLLGSLRREFHVLATLRHPRLAQVFDFGRLAADSGLDGSRGRPGCFFTRELIEGADLFSATAEADLSTICALALQTARLLDVLHDKGMVHGDFKPANVIVDQVSGAPHLIDFGLVRGEGSSVLSGTAAYLPPEVVGGKEADRRADLYSFGVALYQLIVGALPLPKASLSELISWHLHGEPLAPSDAEQRRCRDAVPASLDELVRRLTARDPDRRPPSAAELAGALERVLRELEAEVPARTRSFVAPSPGRRLSEPLARLEQITRLRLNLGADVAPSSEPPAVVLHGEQGNGKTALLQELCWRCQLAGGEALRVSARAGDARAFGPLFDLLEQIAGVAGEAHPLRGQELSDRDLESLADADRFAVHQRVVEYIADVAAQVPLLLVIDALEQADAESREALRFIAHTLAPTAPVLLLLCHSVDAELEALLTELPRVAVEGLEQEDVLELLAATSGRADAAQARAITEHTGGNAGFVLEVLEALWAADWPAHPDLAVLVPASLEQRTQTRWEGLDPAQREVLAALAVAGRAQSGRALHQLLADAGRLTATAVGSPLEQLEAASWLSRDQEGAWRFRDGVAASIVRRLLDTELARDLHRALFERLASRDLHAVEAVKAAQHGLAAGELERAWPQVERALAQLRAMGAYRRAIALARQAAEALPQEDARVATLELRVGELAILAGDYPQAITALEPLVTHMMDRKTLVGALALARAQRLGGDPRAALATLRRLDSEEVPNAERLAALCEIAAAQAVLDDHAGVLATVQRGQALAGEVSPGRVAELWGRRAWALGHSNRHDEAQQAFEQALQRARSAGALKVEADILNRWAVNSWRGGDYAGVEERYRRAVAILSKIGEVERAAVARFNLGGFLLQQGHLAPALEQLTAALRRFDGMGMRQHSATAGCNLGQLQLELGLFEQARGTLERALAEMQASGRQTGVALASLLLALVAAQRGDLEQARQGVARAREIFLAVEQPRDAADASLDLAEIELTAGQPEAAEQAVRRAEGEVELSEVRDLEVRALTLRARVLARMGTSASRDAQQLLDRAFAQAAELDAPRLRWGCHAAAMELSLASGQRRRAITAARGGVEILEQMARDLPSEVQTAFWADSRRRAARQLAQRADHAAKEATAAQQLAPSLAGEGPTLLATTLSPEQGARLTEERFYRLLEIYRQINSELDPERLLGVVMNTAVELTAAERGFLLLGESAGTLRVEITRNLDLEGSSGAYSRSIAERVFASGQPVITVSAHNDPRFADVASVHQLQLESVLCIPVHARGRVAGVLYMESRFTTGRFTPADQRLLMAFGDQVAIALENARLYADNTRKAEQLQLANAEIEALAEERGRLLAERTAQLVQAEQDLAETRRHLEARTGRFGLVGASRPMERLFELIARVAQTDVPVLIEGESGTGKEMVARAIHGESPRTKRRMVCVNCAAIPENLLESELFGHVRGAFTGADREKKGLFAVADGGTLFLDEIGDMPMRMQVDMLRALQEHTIRPVGGSRDIQVDVRVIAASNKPLAELVQAGEFREDLFYRLHVIKLDLPPLRKRADDIPLLVAHFLERIAGKVGGEPRKITRAAMKRLMEYGWPGNVRQLEHALVNAAVLAEGDVLDADDFTLASPRDAAPLPGGAPAPPKSEVDHGVQDKQRILAALEQHSWNKSKAAQALGIPRRTFYRRLKAYRIQ